MAKAQLMKTCPDCGPEPQPVDNFHRCGRGWQTYCKTHQCEKRRKSYSKEAQKAYRDTRRPALRQYMRDYMKEYRQGKRRRA